MPSNIDLNRFLSAQDKVYAQVLGELKSGKKKSHWIWFIFPQLKGLGRSETARYYAIENADEAREYLQHPVLGKRLRECAEAILSVGGKEISEILPHPDDMKLKSSMTLFSAVSDNAIFDEVIDQYFKGDQDAKTLEMLGGI